MLFAETASDPAVVDGAVSLEMRRLLRLRLCARDCNTVGGQKLQPRLRNTNGPGRSFVALRGLRRPRPPKRAVEPNLSTLIAKVVKRAVEPNLSTLIAKVVNEQREHGKMGRSASGSPWPHGPKGTRPAWQVPGTCSATNLRIRRALRFQPNCATTGVAQRP